MSLFSKFKNNLQKTSNFLSSNILNSFQSKKVDNETLEELESVLISADISLDVVEKLINSVRKVQASEQDITNVVLETLAKEIEVILQPKEREIFVENDQTPKILIFIGVNGSGKTTTIGKIASQIRDENKILIAACDTFRAAAIDQLKIWSERVDCRFIFNENSTDPASVVFNGLESAIAKDDDLVIVDTAGRLHTSENLMKELAKISSVIENRFPQFTKFSLITIDASLGQNSLVQAREFGKICRIDGAILTKLDGTAKGGVVFPLYDQLKIPVTFVGVGEGLDDLREFNPTKYVDGIIDKE